MGWCCAWCRACWEYLWVLCCSCFQGSERRGAIRKEDITYILQQSGEELSGLSETYSEERHGSFTSASGSLASTSSTTRDLLGQHYQQIETRRASSLTMRHESSAPLMDLKTIDFWTGVPREATLVQPKLLSPARRDTIGSQGSADQIRPDLYELEESDDTTAPVFEALGSLHFFLSYDPGSQQLMVRVIEARDLPRPMAMDATKQDQAHSNPYVKVCLLPNQKDSRQTSLRKKTQNPRFDENFAFDIPFRELERRTLQLLVKDFDKYSRHRVVGQVLLPCVDLNFLKGLHIWKPLQPVQSVSGEDLGELLFSLCYLPAAGRLNLDVLRAKQLLPTDLVGGAAPYVRVSLLVNDRLVKTKKTAYKKYTLDPVFNESLSFDVNFVQLADSALVISVLDFNGGHLLKDHFIGRLVLGKEASGPHEVTHWKNMTQAQRTPIAQWHSLKSRAQCDEACPASRLIP